jgi:outer membrane protein assembly factor BamB
VKAFGVTSLRAAALFALLLSACAGGGATFRWPEGATEAPASPLRPIWAQTLYELDPLAYKPVESARPAVDRKNRIVVTGARDGIVRAFAVETGKELWAWPMREAVVAAPLIAGEAVFVGSMSGFVTRLDLESGAEDWSYDTGGAVMATPALLGGRLFVTNDNNRLTALDAATGKYLWHKQRQHQREFTITGHAGVAARKGVIFTGFSDGMLVAMAPEDGATIWSRFLGEKSGDFVDVDTTPVLADGSLYAAAYRGGLHQLDPATGDVRWRHAVEGASAPIVRHGRLYTTTAGGELQALRADDGSTIWRAAWRSESLSAPEIAGLWVFVSTGGGLSVVSSATGEIRELWTVYEGISGAPTAAAGRLFVVSNGGDLRAANIIRP